jgi:hypothetical protein
MCVLNCYEVPPLAESGIQMFKELWDNWNLRTLKLTKGGDGNV